MLEKSLRDTWSFFTNHVVALSTIILPIVIPLDVTTAIYQYFFTGQEFKFSEQLIPMIAAFAVYPIYSIGVIFYIASAISGETKDTRTLWLLGVRYWAPYIIMMILIFMVVVAGFLLLIIPGLVIAIRLAFSEFELLLNKHEPTEAMKISWQKTKAYMWVIVGGFLIITIVMYMPYYVITAMIDDKSLFGVVIEMLLGIIYSVIGTLYTIFAFRIFEFADKTPDQPLEHNAT